MRVPGRSGMYGARVVVWVAHPGRSAGDAIHAVVDWDVIGTDAVAPGLRHQKLSPAVAGEEPHDGGD